MKRISVICSQFNKNLVDSLYQEAQKEWGQLANKKSSFINAKNYVLNQIQVPGAGEIPLASKWTIEKEQAQAVLALGVIIKGQTAHFDFLNSFLQKSLWSLQKTYSVPIVFSILLLEKREQAQDRVIRAKEGMQALLKMMELKEKMNSSARD